MALIDSQFRKTLKKIIQFVSEELSAVFGILALPGTIFIFIRLFFFILFSNFLGLMPYIFTRTSHFSITLTLSLPLWLGRILLSIIYQYNNLLAHLVPTGSPRFLIPVIVIIERVRNIIRFSGAFIRYSNFNRTFCRFNSFIITRSSSSLYSIIRFYCIKITLSSRINKS